MRGRGYGRVGAITGQGDNRDGSTVRRGVYSGEGWFGGVLQGEWLSKEESCGEGSTVVGAHQTGEYILDDISPLFTTESASRNLFIRSPMRRDRQVTDSPELIWRVCESPLTPHRL